MPEILSLNNFHLAKHGVRLVYGDTTVYNLHLDQAIGGSITANRMSGNRGDVVTLYNNPSAGYSFDNYSVTGSTLTGVQVRFNREDIYVAPSFTHNVYNINLQQTTGGTITSDKSTGYYGDTVTLSNTPAEHYGFRDYSITGATLTGNQFTINESNVTAKANFSAWPVRNVSVQQRTGGTIASNKSTGYDGDVVTLSNTANAGYTFTNYNVTGATLTGNQFAFNGGNVTAQGAFSAWPELKAGTLRLLYSDGVIPSANGTFTQIVEHPNIWDFKPKSVLSKLQGQEELLEVIDGNLSGKIVSDYLSYNPKLSAVTRLNIKDCTSIRKLFLNCPSLKSVNLEGTESLTDMSWSFNGCQALTSVNTFDTRNVKSMEYLFFRCYSLENIPQFDTRSVTSMNWAFMYCSAIKSVPMFNTSALNRLYETFSDCYNLSSIAAWDLSNLENLGSTFDKCSALTYIPNFNFTKVNNAPYAFAGCWNVSGGITRAYNQLRTTVGEYYDWAFHQCGISSRTGSAELAQIPTGWK